MNLTFIKNISLICGVVVGIMGYNLVFANTDRLSCSGNQGYVNGTACSQGGSVWGVCGGTEGHCENAPSCVWNGSSCGHWVGCPNCPISPPCSPSWGDWGDCSEDCGEGVQKRNNGCGKIQSQSCNNECPGKCGTLNGKIYTYEFNSWTEGTWCDPIGAVLEPNPVLFPTLDIISDGCSSQKPCASSVLWDCSTEFGGTTNDVCSASIEPPTVECGTKSNTNVSNIKPTNPNLCSSSDNNVKVSPEVKLVDGGNWVWGCEHNVFSGIVTAASACSKPSCIATAVSATSPIMLSDNMSSTVSVSCPGSNLCCKITNDQNDVNITVCNGFRKEIEIKPGQNNLSSVCWFEDDSNEVCDLASEVCVDAPPTTVQTMCTSKACNARGTCQSTPQLGTVLSDCTSTCNSNADCSSGRLIETMP